MQSPLVVQVPTSGIAHMPLVRQMLFGTYDDVSAGYVHSVPVLLQVASMHDSVVVSLVKLMAHAVSSFIAKHVPSILQ